MIRQVLSIHLRAAEQKQNGFPFQNKVALKQVKFLFGSASYSACVVYTKTIIHLSVGEKWWIFIYLAALWLDKYPPLFTSTSLNNC